MHTRRLEIPELLPHLDLHIRNFNLLTYSTHTYKCIHLDILNILSSLNFTDRVLEITWTYPKQEKIDEHPRNPPNESRKMTLLPSAFHFKTPSTSTSSSSSFASGSSPTPPPGTHLIISDTPQASSDFAVYSLVASGIREKRPVSVSTRI